MSAKAEALLELLEDQKNNFKVFASQYGDVVILRPVDKAEFSAHLSELPEYLRYQIQEKYDELVVKIADARKAFFSAGTKGPTVVGAPRWKWGEVLAHFLSIPPTWEWQDLIKALIGDDEVFSDVCERVSGPYRKVGPKVPKARARLFQKDEEEMRLFCKSVEFWHNELRRS